MRQLGAGDASACYEVEAGLVQGDAGLGGGHGDEEGESAHQQD
jgi:hypothetical protein